MDVTTSTKKNAFANGVINYEIGPAVMLLKKEHVVIRLHVITGE